MIGEVTGSETSVVDASCGLVDYTGKIKQLYKFLDRLIDKRPELIKQIKAYLNNPEDELYSPKHWRAPPAGIIRATGLTTCMGSATSDTLIADDQMQLLATNRADLQKILKELGQL